MPRITRGLTDGGIYHVLNRGNGRQEIFHKDGDFAAFIELLRLARERHPVTMLEGHVSDVSGERGRTRLSLRNCEKVYQY